MEPIVNHKALTKTKTLAECPKCKYSMDVSWYVELVHEPRRLEKGEKPEFDRTCKGCDTTYHFVSASALDLTMTEVATHEWRGLMLVKRPDEELYIVLEQAYYADRETGLPRIDNEYWVNEHTCPTNWFKVLLIAENGNPDPHGVFEWVRGLTYQDIKEKFGYDRDFLRGEGDDPNAVEAAMLHIFPEIESGGIIIEDDAERHAGQQLLIEQGKL